MQTQVTSLLSGALVVIQTGRSGVRFLKPGGVWSFDSQQTAPPITRGNKLLKQRGLLVRLLLPAALLLVPAAAAPTPTPATTTAPRRPPPRSIVAAMLLLLLLPSTACMLTTTATPSLLLLLVLPTTTPPLLLLPTTAGLMSCSRGSRRTLLALKTLRGVQLLVVGRPLFVSPFVPLVLGRLDLLQHVLHEQLLLLLLMDILLLLRTLVQLLLYVLLLLVLLLLLLLMLGHAHLRLHHATGHLQARWRTTHPQPWPLHPCCHA
jgi:hypothetical protein